MKAIKTKILVLISFWVVLTSLPVVSTAENQIPVQENEIATEIIPENPKPYQDVTINISSYSTDIDKAMIIWQVDSKNVSSGYGKKSYTFKAGGVDSVTNITIKITPVNSMMNIVKQIKITPSEVDLFWEAVDGYTPPFYKGKSFVSKGGTIKVVAIPNTKTIKQGKGSITYSWVSNNNTIQNASGYGKDYYIFKNNILNNQEEVEVSASSINDSFNAKGNIIIPITSPKIVFYKKSPYEGIFYNKNLANGSSIDGNETTIVAEPYFLSYKNMENNFSYVWKINNDNINTPSKKTELTIKPASKGGYVDIELNMAGISNLFQSISEKIRLNL